MKKFVDALPIRGEITRLSNAQHNIVGKEARIQLKDNYGKRQMKRKVYSPSNRGQSIQYGTRQHRKIITGQDIGATEQRSITIKKAAHHLVRSREGQVQRSWTMFQRT